MNTFNDVDLFVVWLPAYKDVSQLRDSKRKAVSQLLAMETTLKFDTKFEKDYKYFMLEYEELKHVTC